MRCSGPPCPFPPPALPTPAGNYLQAMFEGNSCPGSNRAFQHGRAYPLHFFPSGPEEYVALAEAAEIGTYTEEELRREMAGRHRVDLDERWGGSHRVSSDADTDVYVFEDI